MNQRSARRVRRPWHLWAFALLVLAVYVGGLRDYVLILVGDTDYIRAQFGERGVVYFGDYPPVLRVVWTLNIVAGLAAPVLLLIRSRLCVAVAATAAGAQLGLLVVTFAFRGRWEALGPVTSWFDIGVGVLTVGFAVYCWALARRGMLG